MTITQEELELRQAELEQKKAEAEQKQKEEDAAKGPAGVLSSILGFAAPIAGFIPSLLKGPQEDFLRGQQAGGGAGAAIGRQTASEAARRVIGASTAQPSSGRGGSLREGLRAADALVQRGAQQAAITGARESQAATQQLRANQFARRGAARKFGAGVGQGLAGIAGTLAAARDQGPVAPTPEETLANVAGDIQDPVTGLSDAGLGHPFNLPSEAAVPPVPNVSLGTPEQPVGPPGALQAPLQDVAPSPVMDQLAQPTTNRTAPQRQEQPQQPEFPSDAGPSGLPSPPQMTEQEGLEAAQGVMDTASVPEDEKTRTVQRIMDQQLVEYLLSGYHADLAGGGQ